MRSILASGQPSNLIITSVSSWDYCYTQAQDWIGEEKGGDEKNVKKRPASASVGSPRVTKRPAGEEQNDGNRDKDHCQGPSQE